jgi:glutaredoxin-related protein|tara:strand:+ start:3092 stop:3343 length:252 start_codon:yes stop_codon:yes gene_type:complete
MADPQLELYFYQQCGFSRSVLNTIANLGIGDKITLKNIREEVEFERELVEICGDPTVPTLMVDGEAMRESEAINSFLVDTFLD